MARISKTSKTKKAEPERKTCPKCERERALSNFYTAAELLYPDGKFHICKDCISSIVDEQGFKGFMTVLRAMDKPFVSHVYNGDYKSYIRQINSLHQYRGMTYDDSSFDENQNTQSVKVARTSDEEVEYQDTFNGRWTGFASEEAEMLEDKFQKLLTTYPCDTPIQENGYKQIAIIQLKSDQAIMQGKTKEYKDLMETLSKIMNDLKIKPVQENSTEDGGLSNWGSWVKKIEEEEPIPEASGEFKDVDGIGKYINKWFTSHFSKVFGLRGQGEYEEEIVEPANESIEEDGDDDGRI